MMQGSGRKIIDQKYGLFDESSGFIYGAGLDAPKFPVAPYFFAR